MEQTEIILRAIGVLTETNAMVRRIAQDENAEVDSAETQLGALVTEVFPRVEVPGDAGPAPEAGQAVADAYLPATISLVGRLRVLFSELADLHDSGTHRRQDGRPAPGPRPAHVEGRQHLGPARAVPTPGVRPARGLPARAFLGAEHPGAGQLFCSTRTQSASPALPAAVPGRHSTAAAPVRSGDL